MNGRSIRHDQGSCSTKPTSAQNADSRSDELAFSMESILDSLEEGVIIMDRQGVIIKANPAFCQMFAANAQGRPAVSVVPGAPFREMLDIFLHDVVPSLQAAQPFRLTLREDLILSVRITLLKQRTPMEKRASAHYAIAVFHNITDLVRKNRMRREFMGEVAHELRTPLTTIIGFAETILDLPPHHTEDRQKFTGIILRNARHMALLVGDMLHLSKLESGTVPLQLSCVRAAFVLEDALDACTPHLAARELEVDIQVDRNMNIRADAHYITQVFRNLLENACRYAPKGSTITVTGKISPTEPTAQFTVADEGPGIPEEDCSRVFDRFYRVEKERVSPSSTGLGLAICRQIVERHGGKIRAEKGPGGKLMFTVPLA